MSWCRRKAAPRLLPGLSVEKQLMGWELSTLPGPSLFLPFRVPPAFLLQRLGSCDCSTPLTPRLLWKPMNCLRKVSWQPCIPAPAFPARTPLASAGAPSVGKVPYLPAYSAPGHVLSPPLCPPHHSSSIPNQPPAPGQRESGVALCQSHYTWAEAGHPTGQQICHQNS